MDNLLARLLTGDFNRDRRFIKAPIENHLAERYMAVMNAASNAGDEFRPLDGPKPWPSITQRREKGSKLLASVEQSRLVVFDPENDLNSASLATAIDETRASAATSGATVRSLRNIA